MHDQSDWLIEWIFHSPTHDEFLKVVVEILFVKRRRVDRVEELFEVPDADLDSILASLLRERLAISKCSSGAYLCRDTRRA
jgi:hypothetical protein